METSSLWAPREALRVSRSAPLGLELLSGHLGHGREVFFGNLRDGLDCPRIHARRREDRTSRSNPPSSLRSSPLSSDPSSGSVVERLGKVVAGHVVARLPGGDVGLGAISGGLHPDHGRMTRKREAIGGYEQRRGGFLTRIAIIQHHTRCLRVSSGNLLPFDSDTPCPWNAKLQRCSYTPSANGKGLHYFRDLRPHLYLAARFIDVCSGRSKTPRPAMLASLPIRPVCAPTAGVLPSPASAAATGGEDHYVEGRSSSHGRAVLVEDGPFASAAPVVPNPHGMVVVGPISPTRVPTLGD